MNRALSLSKCGIKNENIELIGGNISKSSEECVRNLKTKIN